MKEAFKTVIISFLLSSIVGCVSFPFYHEKKAQVFPNKTRITVVLNNVVKDPEGKDFFLVDDSVIAYAKQVLNSCTEDCSDEVIINAYFVADANSRSNLFKVWQWAGVLSLGLIPVYEKTEFTLVADVKTSQKEITVKNTENRHFIYSIIFLPFNLFRSWKEDLLGVQKHLIDELSIEVEKEQSLPYARVN